MTTSQPGLVPPRGSPPCSGCRFWVGAVFHLIHDDGGQRARAASLICPTSKGEWKAGDSRRYSIGSRKEPGHPHIPAQTMKETRQVSLLPNLRPTMGVAANQERLRPRSPAFTLPRRLRGGGPNDAKIKNGRRLGCFGPHRGSRWGPNSALLRGRAKQRAPSTQLGRRVCASGRAKAGRSPVSKGGGSGREGSNP